MHLADYSCVLCDSKEDESVEHLFLRCPFALECWQILLLHIPQILTPFQILDDLKQQIQKPFFMEIIILMVWSIWQTRNGYIFKQQQIELASIK